MAAPALAVALVLVLPLAYLVARASGASGEVWETLARPRTWEIFGRSLGLMATVTLAAALFAVPMAWLTTRSDLPFRRAFTVLGALPLVVPSYVGAFLYLSALGPRGLLADLLRPLGVTELPTIYGFPGAMLSLTLLSYPYVFLTVRAALQRADPALEETAASLGVRPAATFARVTLPTLMPAITGGSLLVALYTLSDFGAVSLFRYETFTWAIYLQYRAAVDPSGAAALSLVLVSIALAVIVAESLLRRPAAYHRVGVGAVRPARPVPLGYWRWPSFALCASVVGLALLVPVGVLLYWVAQGVAMGERLDPALALATNSVAVSLLGATAATAAALPLGILAVRHAGSLARSLERVAYLSFALPGIVIAFALVFFGARYLPLLYQTMALLVVAYVIHFLAAALASVRVSLLTVGPSLEEAARSLGHGRASVLARVTLPLMWPGLLAGGSLVFLLVMKELPATLLLAPLGFRTLATSLWSFAEAGFFARAAFPALVLLLASSVPMAFLVLREPGRAR
ncbi:MAG TPA: iron ABC transporter permease [Candidatus Limnocylindrales bacterium]|nr:iron ABC transporter permease [Candidatus Limnocylindrales bacterium]